MALTTGTRVGPYQVTQVMGAGGMGEVYRAHDTQLNRDVAIKVLPELFASDPERLARFEREAQTLATLNHPHVAQIYGVERSETGRALVMELVEGEDLSERLAQGPIPVPEALAIARQIADALDGAHERGIIHRDLKPANVKVREDGTIKVLDFGLAKMTPAASGAHGLPYGEGGAHQMNSPTITSPLAMTHLGVILGTAAYMAPEQAKGKTIDRGADLWALGAVLYEMLTGRRAFDGETITDVLAAIVTRDPDWNALPPDTPRAIDRLLRRCLERDRRRRLADAAEARFQIEEAIAAPLQPSVTPSSAPRRTVAWLPWSLATIAAVTAGALAVRGGESAAPVARYTLEPAPRTSPSAASRPSVAISPDGTTVVFVATASGIDYLYARQRNAFEAALIAGTAGASNPVFSPDGQWLAFTTNSKLMKVPRQGGAAVTLAEVSEPRGLSWDAPDAILFSPEPVGGILRVGPDGGTPVPATTPKPKTERTHRWPQLLPEGNAVLFTVGRFESPDNYDDAAIEVEKIGSGERRTILTGAAMGRYVEGGYLLFSRGSTLFAVRFRPDTLEVSGTPVAVLEGLGTDSTTGAAHFSVARTGDLVYLSSGAGVSTLRPAWVDHGGRTEPFDVPPGSYADPRVSPDGQQLAMSVIAGGGRDIWTYHLQRRTLTRVTFGGQNITPVWSPDGSTLYYVSLAPDLRESIIHRRPADGSREAEALVTLPYRTYLNDLSRDGRTLVFDGLAGQTNSDLFRVAAEKGAKPEPIVVSRFDEFAARFSPDGRWLVYCSGESGRREIYARPADGSGGRWPVSTGGGEEAKWAPDGRRIFYTSGTLMMAVPVDATSGFSTSPPTQVLSTVYPLRLDSGTTYDVDPKSGKFVMIRPSDESAGTAALRVIVNWRDELRATLPR